MVTQKSPTRKALVAAAALLLAAPIAVEAQTGESGSRSGAQTGSGETGQAPTGQPPGQGRSPSSPRSGETSTQPNQTQPGQVRPGQPGAVRQQGAQTPPRATQGEASQNRLTRAQQRFVTESLRGNMAEVNMGQIAQQNGQSDDVKRYGQMLATDHGRANEMLQQIADQAGMDPPDRPARKQEREAQRFERMQGENFDRAFLRHMAEEHRKEIKKYQRMARGDGPVAEYANATLPELEKHLQNAQQLLGASGGSQRRR